MPGTLARLLAPPDASGDALTAHRAAQHAERVHAGTTWVDTGLVFTRPNGRAIDPKDDYQTWKTLLADAGVRDARLHDARHTAATIMLTMGVPARAVMQILGHSQITLTLGTYSHVEPEARQRSRPAHRPRPVGLMAHKMAHNR